MRFLSLSVACAGLLAASAAMAQSLKPDEILSSVTVQPISEPNPVLGADGRVHLAYELVINNPGNVFVRLDKVEAIDDAGKSLSSLEGEELAKMMHLYSGRDRQLPPGGTAIVFMDVGFARDDKLAQRVSARIEAFRENAGADGKPTPLPADAPVSAHYSFIGGATTVGKPAVVVEPPLRGTGWVAADGCCDAVTAHRGAVMAVNGRLRIPERFAIDWIRLDAGSRLFTGNAQDLASYSFYGAEVHAAADGVVVNLYDQADEQIPSQPARGIVPANIGGNMLVTDIGNGAFAFYAHLQRGSLRAKLGDRVKAGQVIGRVGNTGNSTAPHLHFQLMDGPSPLNANSLPFVLTRFSGQGVLAPGNEEELEQGAVARIEPRWRGEHANQLPLNDQVVDFQ
ncbi:M23 family metallopeptidase [Labrys sp. KB_33_2]|uniref:M23 family metallopeptidase n=1 Tax=Labrys sp. KB_33_2 TaxID=3237479 RepID=UPI003F929DF8